MGFCLLLLLVTGPGTPEPLQAKNSNYWGTAYRAVIIDDIDGSGGQELSLESGNHLEVSWGGKVSSLRVEYTLGMTLADVDEFTNAGGTEFGVDGTLRRTSLLLNLIGHDQLVRLSPPWSTYWGFGVGFHQIAVRDLEVPGQVNLDDAGFDLTGQLLLGLEYQLSKSSFVSLEYQVSTVPSFDIEDDLTGQTIDFDGYNPHSIGLEFRWFY